MIIALSSVMNFYTQKDMQNLALASCLCYLNLVIKETGEELTILIPYV